MVEIDLEKFKKDFTDRKTKFLKDEDKTIDDLSEILMSTATLSTKQLEFYRARNRYCKEKFAMQGKISFLVSHRRELKYEVFKGLRGQKTEIKNFKDSDIILKNDYERNIVFEMYLKEFDNIIDIMQNFLSYIEGDIATIDKMIFGIQYSIELEQTRKHFRD